MDVESQDSAHPRGRCLDCFLVGTVVCLILTVSAVIVTGTVAIMELQSKIDRPTREMQQTHGSQTGDSAYKMQNFAYIQPLKSELKDSIMDWGAIPYGESSSVSKLYLYDENKKTLQTNQGGYYFLYLNLNLTCKANCKQDSLTINVMNHNDKTLTCKVELPARSTKPVNSLVHKCWTVTRLEPTSRLMSHMEVSTGPDALWELDMNNSGMGVFLVG